MKKQVKNLFALFLTASMAVSLVPADAFAAVHDAVKDATTTTAYEKVEAEKQQFRKHFTLTQMRWIYPSII
jgi:hypothetical protein